MNQQDRDSHFMRLCLDLAARARGRTSPNPLVGAIIVDRQGVVIADGYHHKAGEAHAEVEALKVASGNLADTTLYVNLEPCCHHGKTPPCTDAILASGIKKVVVGMSDPNPKVAGNGIALLKKNGIEVISGVLESECRWLNRAFIKRHLTGLPWLTLKMASTLDGRIADRHGSSRYISGAEARAHVQHLRNYMDCVLIGGTTAVKDNPELTVREVQAGRNPVRAVIDPQLELSPEAKICLENANARTIIFADAQAIQKNGKKYANVELVPAVANDLRATLKWLADHDCLSVLCEGGGRLAGSLLAEKLVDEVHWFIAPKILADSQSVPAVAVAQEVLMKDIIQLHDGEYQQMGEDMLLVSLLTPEFKRHGLF